MKKILLLLTAALLLFGCTSTPTATPTPTPTPEPTATPAASPLPSIAASATPSPSAGEINVTIDSVACAYSSEFVKGLGRMTTVSTNGTAKGPVNTYLDIPSAYLISLDCGSWAKKGTQCMRTEGQPELTRWAKVHGSFWYEAGSTADSMTVKCFNCEPRLKTASVKCP